MNHQCAFRKWQGEQRRDYLPSFAERPSRELINKRIQDSMSYLQIELGRALTVAEIEEIMKEEKAKG